MLFKKLYQSKKRGSRARLGEIVTAHGKIKTPSFVAVGTKGTVKSILPSLLKEIGTQVAFVNTYHLVTHPGVEVIEKAGGIHQYASLNLPLMSDSGGFQVFSLASPKRQFAAAGRIKKTNINEEKQPALIKISDNGVMFRSVFDGMVFEFTPEKSIEYQQKIGADIMMAFDECISYGVSYEYTKEATERTHRWLIRCIKKVKSQKLKVKNEKSKVERKKSIFIWCDSGWAV
jgi:queuine tRNA-ribosyltransferase